MLFVSQLCKRCEQVSMTAHHLSKNRWATQNKAGKDLAAVCQSAAGQDQALSVIDDGSNVLSALT